MTRCCAFKWKEHALHIADLRDYLFRPEIGDIGADAWEDNLSLLGINGTEGVSYPDGAYGRRYSGVHRLMIDPDTAVSWIIDNLHACETCKGRLTAIHTLRLMEDGP